MPRRPRPCTPGVPHHLISRFVDREYRLRDSIDREQYVNRVGAALSAIARYVAYAAMSNHGHDVAVGDEEPLGSALHGAHTGFGLWWNKRYDGLGPVFAERPKSIVVSGDEALANLVAYVHTNPDRAGLVDCPSMSHWTSHRAYLGLVPCPPYLDVKWALAEMGFSSSPSGRQAFHAFVVSRRHLRRDPRLSGPDRSSLEQARELVRVALEHFGLTRSELTQPSSIEARTVRLVLVATATEVFGETSANMARAMGLSTSTLSRLRRLSRGHVSMELVDAYLRGKPPTS